MQLLYVVVVQVVTIVLLYHQHKEQHLNVVQHVRMDLVVDVDYQNVNVMKRLNVILNEMLIQNGMILNVNHHYDVIVVYPHHYHHLNQNVIEMQNLNVIQKRIQIVNQIQNLIQNEIQIQNQNRNVMMLIVIVNVGNDQVNLDDHQYQLPQILVLLTMNVIHHLLYLDVLDDYVLQ